MLTLWLLYSAAFPEVVKQGVPLPHPTFRVVEKVLMVAQFAALFLAWWCLGFSLAYMPADFIINLLPLILLVTWTGVVACLVVKRLEVLWVVNYATIGGAMALVFALFEYPDGLSLVVPVLVVVTLLVAGVSASVLLPSRRWRAVLTRRLVEKRWIAKIPVTAVYLLLVVILFVENFFQFDGTSLLWPHAS